MKWAKYTDGYEAVRNGMTDFVDERKMILEEWIDGVEEGHFRGIRDWEEVRGEECRIANENDSISLYHRNIIADIERNSMEKRWFFMIIEILLFWFKEFFLSEFYWTGTMPSTWDDWDDEPKQNSSSAGFGIEFVWNQWLQIDDWDEKPKKPTRKPSFTGIWRWVASFWWNIMIVLKCRYLGWRWWGYWQEWKDNNLFWYVGWE